MTDKCQVAWCALPPITGAKWCSRHCADFREGRLVELFDGTFAGTASPEARWRTWTREHNVGKALDVSGRAA